MPDDEQKIQTKAHRWRRHCVVASAIGCLGAATWFSFLDRTELSANSDVPLIPQSTIRLGVPAFAFGESDEPKDAHSKPLPAARPKPTYRPEFQPVIQPQPKSQQSSGVLIQPRGSKPVVSNQANRNQQSPAERFFAQASQQQATPSQPSANQADNFWKNVVDGQATKLQDNAAAAQANNQNPIPAPTAPGEPARNVPPIPGSVRIQGNAAQPVFQPQAVSPRPVAQQSQQQPSNQPVVGRPIPLQPQQVPQTTPVEPQDASPLGAHSIAANPEPPPVSSGHSVSTAGPGMSGFRATVEADANHWMSPYSMRAERAEISQPKDIVPELAQMPSSFRPWWDRIVQQPLNANAATMKVNVSNLLQDALLYSPQVVAIQSEPEVKYRIITQEAARFDWTAFLESTYNDLNDPVGNELTTGTNEDRLLTRKWRFSGGLRQRNQIGGEVQLTQDFSHENQNSRFFIPNNQAFSRLELSYRQPLLDGAGRTYNQSELVLARIDANASEDDVVDALQDHLLDVTTAYWTLYRARSEFFQRQKLLLSATEVLNRLEGRAQVDTIPRQVLRARAAVARAKTGIRRTLARVKDAEAQLRLLVNSPGMLSGGPTELLPFEPPMSVTEDADLRSILQTALYNRADISGAIRQMRAAGVRLGVSQQELLPRLDMLVSTYVADLSGGSDLGTAIRGKYVDNRPGYTVGLEFEFPLGNRAARARHEQRQWELKRAINIFRATVEKSLTDVEIGRREVETAHAEMISRYHSMVAAQQESAYLKDRFKVLPEAEDSATLLLEDLLDSFERLADEESAFVRSQIDHALSLINLKKQMGTLLKSRHDRPSIDSAQQQWVQERLQTRSSEIFGDSEAKETAPGAAANSQPVIQPQTKPVSGPSMAPQSVRPATFSRDPAVRKKPSGVLRTSGVMEGSSGVQRAVATSSAPATSGGDPKPHQTKWVRTPLNQ